MDTTPTTTTTTTLDTCAFNSCKQILEIQTLLANFIHYQNHIWLLALTPIPLPATPSSTCGSPPTLATVTTANLMTLSTTTTTMETTPEKIKKHLLWTINKEKS